MQNLKLEKLSIQELGVLKINWLKQNVSILFVRVLLGPFIREFLNMENYCLWHLGLGGFLIWDSGRLDCWMERLQDFELLNSEFLYSGLQDVGFRVWDFWSLGFWTWPSLIWVSGFGISGLWCLGVCGF